MSIDTIIGILGLAISILFGVFGMRALKNKKIKQQQKVKLGSVGIQSGRDTIVNKHD